MLMFLNSPALADPPQIRDLEAGATKVKVFRKFELTFNLSKDYRNPYDAGEIDKRPNCYFNDIDVSARKVQGTVYVSQIEVQ